MFFEGKAEFQQPHAFRNLEEVYPDGQPLPRIDDSDRIEFFESQRFRTGAKGKKQKKKTPEPPRVDAEKEAFAELGRLSIELYRIMFDTSRMSISDQIAATKTYLEELINEEEAERLEELARRETLEEETRTRFDPRAAMEEEGVALVIPKGGIDAEPAEDAEDADVEVVGVSKKEAKKQVKVKVEPEEVIEPEPESDVDSVDDDTEETQVLDAALKTLPKIK